MTDLSGHSRVSRRSFIGTGLLASIGTTLGAPTSAALATASPVAEHRYKIGVCDWMILKRQKLGA
ncbi:MAG TPA: hypothetical protein VK995_00420, partial [Oceanipulchritudo sp.]|nr:hypothetical protein [Oceanipulchritudo sp.]